MTSFIFEDRETCPLCRCKRSEVYIEFPDIPVVRCVNCDFIYSSKTLSEQALDAYYTNDFAGYRHVQGQMVNAKVNSLAIKRLVNINSVSNILDVGTGYGFLLAECCKQSRISATGVELSRQEAEYATNTLGLNVINTPLANSGLNKASYDLVTAFEVIEHTIDPLAFIYELVEYVKPGGYLLIMTDNFQGRMAKSLGAAFPKWIPHSHISHFSSDRLLKLFASIKSLAVVESLSFSPWEILVRDMYYRFRGIQKTPSEAFNLAETLRDEMGSSYKLFPLRKLINQAWAQLTLSNKMDGDLMYFLTKKITQ